MDHQIQFNIHKFRGLRRLRDQKKVTTQLVTNFPAKSLKFSSSLKSV